MSLDIRRALMPRVGLLVPIPLKIGILGPLGSPAMGGDRQRMGSLITAEWGFLRSDRESALTF